MRGRLSGALLAVASIALTLLAIEVTLRLSGFDPLGALRRGAGAYLRVSEHPDVRYELAPGTRGRMWGADVEINSLGFRGPEPSPDSAGRRRVLVLGDSITFGNDLDLAETYPARLGETLRRHDERWEVLNLGVGGYDTLQEVALLEHRGLALRPSVVVVGFSLNDAGVVSTNLLYVNRLQRYRENPVVLHSRLAQFLVHRIDRRRVGRFVKWQNEPDVFRETFRDRIDPIGPGESELRDLMATVADRHPSRWFGDADRIGRIRHAFGRLAGLSRREGFPVAVLVIPWLETEGGAYPHEPAHRIVALEARRAGFVVLDPLDRFLAAGIRSLRSTPDDLAHPNGAGHRILAETLEPWIREAAGPE